MSNAFRNALVAASVIAVILLIIVVSIGRRLTTDWQTIWAAVTGLGAFLSLAALVAAALYAWAQLSETRNAARNSHFFEQVKLTRDLLNSYIPLTERITALFPTGRGLESARQAENAKIIASDAVSIRLRYDAVNALGEVAELYCREILVPDMFLRRADYWICVAWYLYGQTIREWGVIGAMHVGGVNALVRDAYASVKATRPQLLDIVPELRSFDV